MTRLAMTGEQQSLLAWEGFCDECGTVSERRNGQCLRCLTAQVAEALTRKQRVDSALFDAVVAFVLRNDPRMLRRVLGGPQVPAVKAGRG